MAPTAPNLWRRPCYATSRLLQLPRHRWVRPRWRRLPLPPGAVTVGTTVDGTAAGAVPASSSVAPPIMAPVTAAAMCGDWSRRHGASLAVGESLLLIQTVPSRRQRPRPRRAGAFKFDRMEPGFKFLLERGQSAARGNKFCSRDLVQRDLIKTDAKRNRHEQPNR